MKRLVLASLAAVLSIMTSAMATAETAANENVLYLIAPPRISDRLEIVQSPVSSHVAEIQIGTASDGAPSIRRGRVSQTGFGHSLALSVLGSGHLVNISQAGRGHRGIVNITGQTNAVTLHQTGVSHFASVTQSGARNTATIRQGS